MILEGEERGELKVGAHVLIQLGAELVTDAEQALLELVKNAYDADAPGCRIAIDTRTEGVISHETTPDEALRFSRPTENVRVDVVDEAGQPVTPHLASSLPLVRRQIKYQGHVVIEDRGNGISYEDLGRSWLVVSRSQKRVATGPKKPTSKGRTPLGDKGLGRLGTMKLGDVLLVESSTGPDEDLSFAWFRWHDCESAATVDEVPVVLGRTTNPERFKGTRVSVLGLRDTDEWRQPERLSELTRSMARLISPFEAAAAFPVTLALDEGEQSLGMITDELLNQSVASFTFDWELGDDGGMSLYAVAKLSRRLFTSGRTAKLKDRTAAVFDADGGRDFADHVNKDGRFKGYDSVKASPSGRWFVEMRRRIAGSNILPPALLPNQPGPFSGAFYYFFFINDGEDVEAPAVIGGRAGLQVIRDLAGVAILRDGFQVRNRGDWLGLSAGMTTGSTYSMRPENTVGYFSLTGKQNWALREKSDREGFVNDAAYRAFLRIAQECRDFANRALISSRRVLDEYWKKLQGPPAMSADRATQHLGQAGRAAKEIEGLSGELQDLLADEGAQGGSDIGPQAKQRRDQAMALVARVVTVARDAVGDVDPDALVKVIDQEVSEARERNVALVESAAVGQAARGLMHELRTHLAEIRYRAGAIERDRTGKNLPENLTRIRYSCSAIASAASQIDPMLPRTRAVKERFELKHYLQDYAASRETWLSEQQIDFRVLGVSTRVRMNRARLLQVFDNVVRNSAYWLSRAEVSPKVIAVEINDRGVVISDNGPGVDPVVEESLFELFVTMRSHEDGGQGLGLFISSELLALDGCSISLLPDRNAAGRRYRFAIDLTAVVES